MEHSSIKYSQKVLRFRPNMLHLFMLYNETEAFLKVKFDKTPCWTSLGNYRRISLRAIRLKYKNWYF